MGTHGLKLNRPCDNVSSSNILEYSGIELQNRLNQPFYFKPCSMELVKIPIETRLVWIIDKAGSIDIIKTAIGLDKVKSQWTDDVEIATMYLLK